MAQALHYHGLQPSEYRRLTPGAYKALATRAGRLRTEDVTDQSQWLVEVLGTYFKAVVKAQYDTANTVVQGFNALIRSGGRW